MQVALRLSLPKPIPSFPSIHLVFLGDHIDRPLSLYTLYFTSHLQLQKLALYHYVNSVIDKTSLTKICLKISARLVLSFKFN